jgi:hypothetical protein
MHAIKRNLAMDSFPTIAQIRAERAARDMRGVVLPFQPPVQKEIAAENARAAGTSWGDLWGLCFEFWGDICLDTLDVMRHTALGALDGYIIGTHQDLMVCEQMEVIAQAQERNRQAAREADAEHTGRLIGEIFEEG